MLSEESGEPGGVDAGKTGGGLDGGVAADDAGAVFVDVEADAEAVHLTVLGVGELEVVVRAVDVVELERGAEQVLGAAFLHHFHFGDVLAHLDHAVIQSGVENVDLLDQRADVAHTPERVAFKSLGNLLELSLKSFLLDLRKDSVWHKPDHKALGRVVVKCLTLDKIRLAAMRAFPHEQRAVLDFCLEFRILSDIYAVPDFDSVLFSAGRTNGHNLL